MPKIANISRTAKVSDVAGDIRVDAYLTNFSVAYRQARENFVAGAAATSIPVNHESDKYAVFPRGYFWRDLAKVRPLGGRPEQVRYKVQSEQYLAEEWALEWTIDDRQRSNAAAPVDVEESGVMLLDGMMLIREDRIWAQKFMQQGVWTHEAIGDTDFAPFNDAASDPVEIVEAERINMARNTGFAPNTIVFGANVRKALKTNPAILDRIKYTQTGIITDQILASMFEVQTVRTAMGIYNAADEGEDDDLEFIVDENSMWMGYIEPAPRLDAPTAIARFAWTGLIPGTAMTGGVITRGRDGRAYSDWIHSRAAYDYRLVSADLGIYFVNANIPVSN